QRGEDLHELRRLKLKRSDVDPRLHVRGELSPHEQVQEQQVADAVKKRRDVEEDVIVDAHEGDHESDADRHPENLFVNEIESRIDVVRRAVDEHAADRRDQQRGADEIEVDQRQRANVWSGHQCPKFEFSGAAGAFFSCPGTGSLPSRIISSVSGLFRSSASVSICCLNFDSYIIFASGAASVPPCAPACSTKIAMTICGLST